MPERHVIACMVLDNSLIAECTLSADDFTVEAHRQIYSRIQQMAMRREPFDVVTLGSALDKNTGRNAWVAMIGEMLQEVPSTKNFKAYVELVSNESHKRKVCAIGQELREGGGADNAITQLMGLKQAQSGGGKIIDAVNYSVAGIERIANGGNPGIKTGLKDLDKRLGGFHKSDLVVIAGRPSMGKTAVMMNMANNSDVSTGIVSAEQSMEQIGQRMLAINGDISVHRMRNGSLTEEDWKNAVEVLTKIQNTEIYIEDKPYMTLQDIQRRSRQWKHHHDIKIIFIDYLQKIKGTKETTRDEVSEVVVGLKNLARELDIPVVALAQVKRGVERPFMDDIAESGVIEREADQIITLYRDEVYNPDTTQKGVLELNICKNRHGPLGVIKTTWIPEYMQVKDYQEMWPAGVGR